jgi:colanic acid biosynthesis protein WcaH
MQKSSYIDDALFRDIIENIPLVSLDLLVKRDGNILLGRRLNDPAKGYWFTIGGRILKNERIDSAISRITQDELGTLLDHPAEFVGVFEHLYDDSNFEGVSTHYINLVYEVEFDSLPDLPRDQHDAYRWFTVEELMESGEVHRYIKEIFEQKR